MFAQEDGVIETDNKRPLFFFFAFRGMTSPMFIQNGFSNKVPAVTARMEAAYKLRAEFKQNLE